ncbi:hypothetical protein J2Y41_004602 [Arthrobacter sp. 1088]|uniref:hypothetical protein n=1 Tax=Arthrobacter sp. 1088 TaxID=2817768 RepID=UPI00285699E9|nr:hypothetical protein [Arthrobacter sp. 1088]MDR6689002.1 hypothetical protein [Arthrobacter sp. 1088]
MSISATGVAPLPTVPSQKAVLPSATPTPTATKGGRPDLGQDNHAPTNAGVLSVKYSAACNTSTCTFTPQIAYPPAAACSFDAGNGTTAVQFQCNAGMEYIYPIPGVYYAQIANASGEFQTIMVTATAQQPPTETSTPKPTGTSVGPSDTPTASGSGSGSPIPSGTDSPNPTTTTSPEPGSNVQKYLEKCLKGTVAYSPPSSMELGRREEFVLRVALQGASENPATGFPSGSPVATEHPRICALMRADLTGEGFDIERRGDSSGVIALPSDEVGEWGWYITPNKPGKQTLSLRLIAPIPDVDGEFEVETYKRDIDVSVGILQVVGDVTRDWAAPLGITVPVIIAAIGALYLRARRNRYDAKHAAATK